MSVAIGGTIAAAFTAIDCFNALFVYRSSRLNLIYLYITPMIECAFTKNGYTLLPHVSSKVWRGRLRTFVPSVCKHGMITSR